ncbi:MAG: hypothetical protein JW969_06365, partial [Spirochaetales bacterium]|nr:hypothetical protein [Spirochaetales bacterium]
MEKIKRYGDKIKENLSAFVDERTNDIRNLAIDIQVNLKTGKEIIKRIREVEDNLDNRAQQMVTIQDKLSDYDTILKNLDIATGEADENLHRLTEESRVIETFRKQLREASGKMNEMQKAIPLIQNELHQKNTTELQQVASQIKNDAVSYVTALQGKVEKSDKMVKDFALYLSRLEAKRESMEQETARNLKKIAGSFELEAQEMKSRLMGDFNTGLASSLSDVKAKSEDVKKELFEFMDASDIKLSTLEEGFKKKIHTFKETTATIGNNFQKGLDNIIALGKTSQDKMMQKFKSLIRENEDKVKMEVEKRIGTINHEFDAGKEQLMKELAKSRNSLESWKITMAADLKKAQEDNKKKFDELAVISHSAREGIYKTLEEKTSSFESSFNARVDEALKKVKSVDAVRAEFAQKINEFHKEMDVFSQEMGTRIDTMRDESLGKLSGTAESMELTIVNAVEKRMEEYEKDFNYRFQKLENLNHDVEDFDANLKSYIEGRKVEFKQELDKYIQFVGTERTREQEKTEQLFTKIHSEIKNLEQGLMQLKAEAYQDVSEKLKGFEDDFFSDLKTRLSKMEENLTHYKDNITRKLEDITEMNVKERIDIEAKYNEEIMSKLNLVRENTKTEVERIQSWISDLDTKMKDNSTVWDETIETFNRRIEEEWDSKTMESGVVFERKFKAFEQNINDMLAACRNDMETRITAYSTQLEQDRGGYKEYFDSAKNDLEEWENDMNRKLAESRNRLAENIDSMKSELDQHMRSFKSEYFAQQQEIVDSSRDERDSIKQEIEDLSGRIKGLDDGFNAKTRLLHENLQKEYSVQNEELNKSIEEIGASFEDKFKVFEKNMNEMLSVCRNDVESRIAAYSNQIEQDRNSYKNYFDVAKESLVVWEDDMNKKIADTRAKITSNTQSLKLILDEQIKTVKADIDSQQEEILDSTREERDQIRQEITDLSARLGEFDDGFNTRTKFLQENLEKEYTERSTEFNRTVEEMKVSFERKVDTVWQNVAKDIHDNAEKWQKELGMLSDSGEKIRNELSQINEKQAECREKYAEFITIIDGMEVIEKDFNTVRQEIDLFKDEVNHLEPEMAKIKSFEASFSQTREKTEELTREIDRMSVEIENKFNKISSDSDLAREQIEEVLRSYEERIETWQQQQTGRLNEYLDDLDDRTESFKKNVKATIKDMENEFLSR